MNASKEQARQSLAYINMAATMLDAHVDNVQAKNDIKRTLLNVQEFCEAAERKLPTEAAYKRDRQRRAK